MSKAILSTGPDLFPRFIFPDFPFGPAATTSMMRPQEQLLPQEVDCWLEAALPPLRRQFPFL
jgi:hypothetical protein